MKSGLDLTISRLGGFLAQLEQGHVPCSQTQPFQEAMAALESLRAVQKEPHTKEKALSAIVSADSANYSADQAPRIEAPNTPEGYI